MKTMPSHCPQWSLDDWPPFQVEKGSSLGYVDTHSIERLWREQFDFLYKEYKQFVFPISSIHPQVSGKPQVILMLRRFIEYFKTHEGMEWCTFEKMVEEGALKKVVWIAGERNPVWGFERKLELASADRKSVV